MRTMPEDAGLRADLFVDPYGNAVTRPSASLGDGPSDSAGLGKIWMQSESAGVCGPSAEARAPWAEFKTRV